MRNLIANYPKGSNLTILNAVYDRPEKDEETGKWIKDSITIVYKDNNTGKKSHYTIYEPNFSYYILPESKDPGYHQFFVPESDLIKVTCKYKDLLKDIATRLGRLDEYEDNVRAGNRSANKMLHADRRLFESDIGINNYYRMLFKRWYTNQTIPVTKSFIDIEVDIKTMKGNFPEMGECPINAISYLEFETKELTTVLYDDGKNPLATKFIENLDEEKYQKEFRELLSYALGGEDRVKDFELENIKTKIIVFKDEIDMLHDLFQFINFKKPDFVLAWNMAFDIPYIIARIINLGYDPIDIMCDEEFPVKKIEYFVDAMHYNEFSRRGDYANISCSSVYIDQLIQFASRRRGQSVFQSMKLDYIGEQIAKVRKLDYSDITSNISDLPYLDYDRFVKYNMMDVVVQYCIEHKTNDVGYLFNKAIQNSTEYRKVHRQTVYLANRAVTSFYDYGKYICGNNINKFKDTSIPTEKYEGAFVSDPTLISPICKDTIGGYPIGRVRNGIDFDFTSLYPSLTREFNLAPNTQIGFINIPNEVHKDENPGKNPKYTRSGAYLDDLISDNYIEFARRWFHLASFRELYEDIVDYYTTKAMPFYDIGYNIVTNKIIPIATYGKNDVKIPIITDKLEPEFKTNTLSENQKEKLEELFGGDINYEKTLPNSK